MPSDQQRIDDETTSDTECAYDLALELSGQAEDRHQLATNCGEKLSEHERGLHEWYLRVLEDLITRLKNITKINHHSASLIRYQGVTLLKEVDRIISAWEHCWFDREEGEFIGLKDMCHALLTYKSNLWEECQVKQRIANLQAAEEKTLPHHHREKLI